MFNFKETIKAKENYKIYKTNYLLGKPTGEIAHSGFYTYVEYDFKIGIDKWLLKSGFLNLMKSLKRIK